jgi:hypothetical protein
MLQAREFVRADEIGLVDHQHVAEFDLLDQQFDERAIVFVGSGDSARRERIVGTVVAQEVVRIDDRHERVEPRDARQRGAVVVDEREGFGDRHRLGDAGRFDHDRIEAAVGREIADLDEQVVAQRAADAAVRHLDEPFLDVRQRLRIAHERRVDVDRREVVDDHRDLRPARFARM